MASCVINNENNNSNGGNPDNNNSNGNVSEEIYTSVLPGAFGFEDVDISVYNDEFINGLKEFTSFDAVKREISGKGYVFQITQSGYHPNYFFDIVLVIGINIDGIITGVKWINHDPALGLDINYGDSLVGKDINDIVEINEDESYKYGITRNVAHFSAAIHCGSVYYAIYIMCLVENKETGRYTEEEIFAIKLNKALPEGNSSFTKMNYFGKAELIEIVYKADNGAGYVCFTPEGGFRGTYIGVGVDGKARGDVSDYYKQCAEKAVVYAEANRFFDIDLSQYSDNDLIANKVKYAAIFAESKYYIEIKAKGYQEGLIIGVVVEDGIVLSSICISSNETWGLEETLGDKFIGENIDTVVDVEAGATSLTVNGYRGAVRDALTVFEIINKTK